MTDYADITQAGTLNLHVKGDDYTVRVMRPDAEATLNELQLSLTRNRQMLANSFVAMQESCRDDLFKRKEKQYIDHLSPTQNALVARANIDMLIPLINIKGGIATYENKKEALPLEKHILKLRNKALEIANEEDAKESLYGFMLIIGVVAIMGALLFIFL